MNETIFEQVEASVSALKMDFSAEKFARFAEDQELLEAGMESVWAVFSYLSRKKQQTTIQKLLKMSRLPTQGRQGCGIATSLVLVERYLSSLQLGLHWPGRYRENPSGPGVWVRLLPARVH